MFFSGAVSLDHDALVTTATCLDLVMASLLADRKRSAPRTQHNTFSLGWVMHTRPPVRLISPGRYLTCSHHLFYTRSTPNLDGGAIGLRLRGRPNPNINQRPIPPPNLGGQQKSLATRGSSTSRAPRPRVNILNIEMKKQRKRGTAARRQFFTPILWQRNVLLDKMRREGGEKLGRVTKRRHFPPPLPLASFLLSRLLPWMRSRAMRCD